METFKKMKSLIPFWTWYLCRKNGYSKAWKIILNCFRFETGNFTSRLVDIYNICGMRPSSKRPQNRIGVSNGYAEFSNFYDCIEDYLLRQKSFKLNDTDSVNVWIHELKQSKYFEANENDYTKGVNHYFINNDSHDTNVVIAIVVGLGVIGLSCVFVLYKYAQKNGGIDIFRTREL